VKIIIKNVLIHHQHIVPVKKPYSDSMLQCDLCNEYYHRQCLPYHGSDVNTSVWWSCDYCVRSRRPRLQDVVKLLASLQKLTVRLPEGEILQCLTERAMAWQEKAEQFLVSPLVHELAAIKRIKEEVDVDPNKRSSEVPLNKLAENQLELLLIEGSLLEIHVDQLKLLTKLIVSPRRSISSSSNKPKLARMQSEKMKSTMISTVRKRKSHEALVKTEKPIRRKRSRKSLVGDQHQSDVQPSSSTVVYVSSPNHIQLSLSKSSPKLESEYEHPSLIADDVLDHTNNRTSEKTTVAVGNGEDECAVDSGTCLKPSGASIKWVCCDACERWFHLACVGLTSVKKKEEFKCARCKQSSSTMIPSVSTSSSSTTTTILMTTIAL